MAYQITSRGQFAAAHQLRLLDGTLEPLHGHNWRYAVTVESARLDPMGCVMDFHELQRRIAQSVGPLHNAHLNDLRAFASTQPSAENVAVYLAGSLNLPQGVRLVRVEVWETDENRAVFRPDAPG